MSIKKTFLDRLARLRKPKEREWNDPSLTPEEKIAALNRLGAEMQRQAEDAANMTLWKFFRWPIFGFVAWHMGFAVCVMFTEGVVTFDAFWSNVQIAFIIFCVVVVLLLQGLSGRRPYFGNWRRHY